MSRHARRLSAALLLALFLMGALPAVGQAELLFPDLKTLPPRDLRLARADVSYDGSGQFHNVLRFTNTVWNSGEGRLETRAQIDPVTRTGPALQRVANTDGSFAEYGVGGFYWHAQNHQHYHYDDWGRYELWDKADYDAWIASGRTVGQADLRGTKTTSCVMDEEFIKTLPVTPYPAVFPSGGCLPGDDNELVQGLSVGWGDTYDYYRDEQWIDLDQGSLANGQYVLRSVTDPNNKVYESPGKADVSREAAQSNEAITVFTIQNGAVVDTKAPSGTVAINNVDSSTSNKQVTVKVTGRDDVSGVDQVRLSADGVNWRTHTYTSSGSTPTAILCDLSDPAIGGSAATGERKVFAQFKDRSGKWGATEEDSIVLQTGGGGPGPTDPTVAAPDDLSAMAATETQVELRWDDNSNNETEFAIQRATDAGFGSAQTILLGENSTAYSDTGLTPGTQYHYRVLARNATVSSAWSSPAAVSTPGVPPPAAGYSQTVLADDPVSYWRLGEASGSSAVDQRAVNPGLYLNGAAPGAAGLLAGDEANKAVALDGVDDAVRFSSSSSLGTVSAPVTLEAWIEPSALPAAGEFASILTKAESLSLQLNGPQLEFTVMQFGTRQRLQAPVGAIVPGQTYHVVATHDGTTRRLYIDGDEVANAPLDGGATSTSNDLFIGSWDGQQEFFSGTVDDVAVYKKALSAGRVAVHYADGSTPPVDPPSTPPATPQPPLTGRPPATISAASQQSRVTFGQPVSIKGTLTGGASAGEKVVLQSDPFPFDGRFVDVASATTAASGAYAISHKPRRNTRYRVTRGSLASGQLTVLVRIRAGLRVGAASDRLGRVRFAGLACPAHPRALVRIQRRSRGSWRTVAWTRVKASTRCSSYEKRLRVSRDGTYRAVVAGDRDHVPGASPARSVDVP